jgi:phospholipase/carboxylesterase
MGTDIFSPNLICLVVPAILGAVLPDSTPRLSVRPHEMATGTRTVQAGEHRLDSLDNYLVYVPKQCVGTRRVPLIVLLPGGGENSRSVMDERWGRKLADRYGMILLVPNAVAGPGVWDVFDGLLEAGGTGAYRQTAAGSIQVLTFPKDSDVRHIDAALKQVLRKYAIDPDKIALAGMSNGGSYALFLGRSNLDVFSRIGAMSGLFPFAGTGPQNQSTQFFLSGSVTENGGHMVYQTLRLAQELRQEGHPVETVLCLRRHEDILPDYEYMWGWLATSWRLPGAASPVRLSTVADSDPVLTVEVLAHITTFWTHFMQEPDSILTTSRLANQTPIPMSIGPWPVSVLKANMAGLAAKYPSVAADLRQAGLTARQEEADRVAIIRVGFTRQAGTMAEPVAATSVLGRNLAFRNAHDQEFQALAKTGMWITQ